MSRVELYERIRKDNRDEGLSIRALAAKHHVHRRTVREALASAVPPERKAPVRESPALGPWMLLIQTWLVADREAPRKQRHTARRVHQRLVAEYGARVAESTARVCREEDGARSPAPASDPTGIAQPVGLGRFSRPARGEPNTR